MHIIKKYANRKLYDINEKRYVTMSKIAALVREGKEIKVIDNETGEDITSKVLSQLLAREDDESKAVPSGVLMQMLRKGGGTLFGYGKKYFSLWQNALLMSKDEIEKFVNHLVKEKEISEQEGKSLAKDIISFTNGLREWIKETIDKRVNEALDLMNLATKEQTTELAKRVDLLQKRVEALEKLMQSSQQKAEK